MAADNNLFLILDGTAMLFRGYFSEAEKLSPGGVPVSGIYGIAKKIGPVMQKFKPRYAAVVLDAGQYTFRNKIYPDYKMNRGDPPDSLKPQFAMLANYFTAMGFAVFQKKNFEADDLAASLSHLAGHAGINSLLHSNDKDLCQLVKDGTYWVRIYDPMKDIILSEEEVFHKHGVMPHQFVDYLSLTGDASDNIPGGAQIGPKAAAAMLNDCGTLQQILKNPQIAISARVRGAGSLPDKINFSVKNIQLAQKLIPLKKNLKLNIHKENFKEKTRWTGVHSSASLILENLGFSAGLKVLSELYKENY